jgi:hypothetical protein
VGRKGTLRATAAPPGHGLQTVKQGKIPSFQIGTKLRFRKDVIMRWLSEKSEGAGKVRKVIDTGIDEEVRGPKR